MIAKKRLGHIDCDIVYINIYIYMYIEKCVDMYNHSLSSTMYRRIIETS